MEQYLRYKAADFAGDLEFIKWVQSDFTEYADKWDTFMNDNPSLGDEISEAIDIIELFQFDEPAISESPQENLLARINTTLDKVPSKKPIQPTVDVADTKVKSPPKTQEVSAPTTQESKSILRYLIPLVAAACIGAFALFNMGDANTENGNSVIMNRTEISETINITLPDQSIVNLNASSSLSYDKANFSKERVLQLDGEAFFNVEKGQKFIVKTKNGSVEVLGTSFNVFSRNNFFQVECKSGEVKVVDASGQSAVLLTPDETCKLSGKKLVKKATRMKESEWVKGIYHFENIPLLQVIEELERQFKVSIVMTAEVQNKMYTGTFEKNNLTDALRTITSPLGLTHTIEASKNKGKTSVIIKMTE